jgi:type II secretory pathway pseudopilin PulG
MAARDRARRRCDAGYAMAALLVGMAVMAVMASVAMPAWRALVQRENEEELVFRGQQYVRAIRLFQRKYANAFPPSLDLLIDQRFLRKKYKDPVNKNEDFLVLYQGMMQQQAGGRGAAGAGGPAGALGGESMAGAPPGSAQAGQFAGQPGQVAGQPGAGPRGGIVGVASKSTEKSFRVYNGRSVYNEWQFVFVQQGLPGRGAAAPGGRGMGPGGGRGMQQPGGMGAQPGGRGMQQGGRGFGPGGRGGRG